MNQACNGIGLNGHSLEWLDSRNDDIDPARMSRAPTPIVGASQAASPQATS
jgi:hypothetical protein